MSLKYLVSVVIHVDVPCSNRSLPLKHFSPKTTGHRLTHGYRLDLEHLALGSRSDHSSLYLIKSFNSV